MPLGLISGRPFKPFSRAISSRNRDSALLFRVLAQQLQHQLLQLGVRPAVPDRQVVAAHRQQPGQLLTPGVKLARGDTVPVNDLARFDTRPQALRDDLPLLLDRPPAPRLATVINSIRCVRAVI
jgi:hypothetical protein